MERVDGGARERRKRRRGRREEKEEGNGGGTNINIEPKDINIEQKTYTN